LKDNERVVNQGAYGLGDGTKIKIIQSEQKKENGKEPGGDKEK